MKRKLQSFNKFYPVFIVMFLAIIIGCSTWSRHEPDVYGEKNKGDMEESLANMNKVMGMDMQARKSDMTVQEKEAIDLGNQLFHDATLSTNSKSCNSCHPNGETTGGEVEIPKKMGHGPYKLPIPTLIGAAARFPKYKVPFNLFV